MFIKSDIRRIDLVISRKSYEHLIYALGSEEYIHLAAVEDSGFPKRKKSIEKGAADIAYVLSSAEQLLKKYDPELLQDFEYDSYLDDMEKIFFRDPLADRDFVDSVKNKWERYDSLRSRIDDALEKTENDRHEILNIIQMGSGSEGMGGLKFIVSIWGETGKSISADDLHGRKDIYLVVKGRHVLCMTLRDNREDAINFLGRYGFRDRSYMLEKTRDLPLELKRLEKRIEDLKKRRQRIEKRFAVLSEEWMGRLAELAGVYTVLAKVTGAREKHLVSEEVMVISGWIDREDVPAMETMLREICGHSYFLRVSSKRERMRFRDLAPVNLKNNFLFRPFELLVKNLGIPGNSEVDPTPLTALTFVIMFGVMFGDVGQGLVLVLTGFILRRAGASGRGKDRAMRDGGGILVACGLSAVIFGFLYGSFFSNEHVIPAIWFHPMEHMMQLFSATIMMGALFIVMGISMNILNGLVSGDWEESLLGTKGLPGLAVYAIIIVTAVRFMYGGAEPEPAFLALGIGLPVGIFSIRNAIMRIFSYNERLFPHGAFEYVVETVVELIEMFSGFLGNTISFIRAGAFALSHAGLSIAIYTLAEIISPDMTGIAVWLVLFFGNIFIILLEGLVCGIQSMRLEYYEFFSRFFRGDGVPFEPFSLRK